MKARDHSSIDPADYSALSSFLRGYLHEDSALEYDSLVSAARSFRSDADERETAVVRSELDHLLEVTHNAPESDLLGILETDLGCRWHFHSRNEVEQLRDALK